MPDTNKTSSSRTNQPVSRRPPTKRRLVVSALEREIRGGQLRPGERLPSHVQLAKRFHTGSVTIRSAIEELVSRGLIETVDRSGTYVVEHLPYSYRYALVFPDRPRPEGWVYFWVAIVNEARRLTERGPLTIDVYYNAADAESAERKRLQADITAGTLAGIIFPIAPTYLEGTPILEGHAIPMVAQHGDGLDMPSTNVDQRGMIERGVDLLAARGVRRPAVIMKDGLQATQLNTLKRKLREHGYEVPDHWLLPLPSEPATTANRVCQLLMNNTARERPDGLFILDDNLVEGCTAGLTEAGIRTPDELQVLAHANFPWPTPSLLSITRIGYDIRRLMATWLRLLHSPDGGAARIELIPAQFEDELPADDVFDAQHAELEVGHGR